MGKIFGRKDRTMTHTGSDDQPPAPELEDVPPEEWAYWNAQALWGCAVIGALMLALFLPLLLMPSMDDNLARLTGFGVGGALAVLSIAMIYRLTNQKRRERRAALRRALDERASAADPPARAHTDA
jgi:hypothetical protein